MPTQLNYVNGQWLDREEELLARRTELLAEKNKQNHVITKDDFATRMAADPAPSPAAQSAPPLKSAAAVCSSQISPDLVTAADGLLSLGVGRAEGTQQPADITPVEVDEKSSSTAAASSENDTRKRQVANSVGDNDNDQPPKKKKKYGRKCTIEGCTKLIQSKGVCIQHGAKLKRCNAEGCPNRAVKGGVCKRHGAVVVRKKCSIADCVNLAVKGGICHRHGAARTTGTATVMKEDGDSGDIDINPKIISKKTPKDKKKKKKGRKANEDSSLMCQPVTPANPLRKQVKPTTATKQSYNRKICKIEGCNTQAKQGGLCVRHGAKWKSCKCTFPNCTKYAQRGGVCIEHGAVFVRKRCSVEGCMNGVKKRGLCRRHGAYEGETPPK